MITEIFIFEDGVGRKTEHPPGVSQLKFHELQGKMDGSKIRSQTHEGELM